MASRLRRGSAPSKPTPIVDWETPTHLPGRPISELKGKHCGAVALLFNGPSLARHDLFKIKTPLIGMNRTHSGWPNYNGPQPDYLCIVDKIWLDHPTLRAGVRKHPAIINGTWHEEPIGYRVRRNSESWPFSFDLSNGYADPKPCTVGHLALQTAAYLGFTELYCYGFDLAGDHFDGTRAGKSFNDAIECHKAQARLLEQAGVAVYVVGSPESKAPFAHLEAA